MNKGCGKLFPLHAPNFYFYIYICFGNYTGIVTSSLEVGSYQGWHTKTNTNTHTYTHTHTHTHVHTHTTKTYTHTYKCTHTLSNTYTHKYTHTVNKIPKFTEIHDGVDEDENGIGTKWRGDTTTEHSWCKEGNYYPLNSNTGSMLPDEGVNHEEDSAVADEGKNIVVNHS